MGVEMEYFRIIKSFDSISGSFALLNHNLLKVNFTVQGNQICLTCNEEQFKDPVKKANGKKRFDDWLKKEKEKYIAFVQRYLNEIKTFDTLTEFKGEIIREEKSSTKKMGEKKYNIDVKYKNFPHIVHFIFFSDGYYEIMSKINLPINSAGDLGYKMLLGHFVEKETRKHLWKPIREKTKYRLELLHMLR